MRRGAIAEATPEDQPSLPTEAGASELRPVRMVPVIDLVRIRDEVQAAGASEGEVEAAVAWARRER